MTLEQLQVLGTLGDLATLKKTSEQLFKTQPALSKSLKNLETWLGFALFDRSEYRLKLTANGKQIYYHALKVLEDADKLQQMSKHIQQGLESKLVIAYDSNVDFNLLLPMVEHCQIRYPQTQLVLQQFNISGAVQSVLLGQADMAISMHSPMHFAMLKIDLQLMGQFDLQSYASQSLVAKLAPLTDVAQLKDICQIVLQDSGEGSGNNDFGVMAGQRRMYVNSQVDKLRLIQAGLGWGKLPTFLAQAAPELVPLELAEYQNQLSGDLCLIKNKHQVFGPIAQDIWQQASQWR